MITSQSHRAHRVWSARLSGFLGLLWAYAKTHLASRPGALQVTYEAAMPPMLGVEYRDEFATVAFTECDTSGGGREEGVVAALGDIVSGVDLGAALPDDDSSGTHDGAVVRLNTESLGL
jgi:hypothetical protein